MDRGDVRPPSAVGRRAEEQRLTALNRIGPDVDGIDAGTGIGVRVDGPARHQQRLTRVRGVPCSRVIDHDLRTDAVAALRIEYYLDLPPRDGDSADSGERRRGRRCR